MAAITKMCSILVFHIHHVSALEVLRECAIQSHIWHDIWH